MFYGRLVVTRTVSTSEKPPCWKSMACNSGTLTVLRAGICSQTVAIGWPEFSFFVGNYVDEIEKFNHIISCFLN